MAARRRRLRRRRHLLSLLDSRSGPHQGWPSKIVAHVEGGPRCAPAGRGRLLVVSVRSRRAATRRNDDRHRLECSQAPSTAGPCALAGRSSQRSSGSRRVRFRRRSGSGATSSIDGCRLRPAETSTRHHRRSNRGSRARSGCAAHTGRSRGGLAGHRTGGGLSRPPPSRSDALLRVRPSPSSSSTAARSHGASGDRDAAAGARASSTPTSSCSPPPTEAAGDDATPCRRRSSTTAGRSSWASAVMAMPYGVTEAELRDGGRRRS